MHDRVRRNIIHEVVRGEMKGSNRILLLTYRQALKECTAFSVDRILANQPAQEI